MAGNQVTLTFAADTGAATKAFSEVGESARVMERSTGEATRSFSQLGDTTDDMATKSGTAAGAFGALQSGIDLSRMKAQKHAEALQDEARGSQDAARAADDQVRALKEAYGPTEKLTEAQRKEIAAAEQAATAAHTTADAHKAQADAATEAANKESALQTGLMVSTLAFDALSGVTDLSTLALKSNIVTTVGQKAAVVGSAVASGIARTATLAWTAAQWLLNVALTANPIGLIIVAVGALIAVIVLIATKTTWFQDIWRVTWTWIKKTSVSFWDWIKGLPDRLGGVFKKVGGFITAPFRAAFNFIADAWNNTVGRLQWNVPTWVPYIGGNSIGAPQLPKFHNGGVVPGAPGSEMLAILQAGETVTPAGRGGNRIVLEIKSGGSKLDDAVVEIVHRSVRRGGPGAIGLAGQYA